MKGQSIAERRNTAARLALATLCAGAVLASSGCSWFRGSSAYELSPQERPLEVPPDLSTPATNPAMAIPEVGSGPRTPMAPAPSDEVLVSDSVASTWRRVGLALARIDGASISERAELLSVYTVSYRGESFLLRVQEASGGSKVSAVSQDGTPLTGGAAAALLGALRQRLG